MRMVEDARRWSKVVVSGIIRWAILRSIPTTSYHNIYETTIYKLK